MKTAKVHRLGELQLRILKVLWGKREGTVGEVHEALSAEDDFAYTTIATMLRKMEARGLVKHRTEGRTFIYAAMVAEHEVTKGALNDLVDRFFEGSLAEAMNHLLTSREVSKEELARMQKLIEERKKKL
ncbi:MAG TPA: BlaI/MecI/CopY family transcriptional regulator [Verrucomicrobiae bacterium]